MNYTLYTVGGLWNFFLFFFFIVLPAVFFVKLYLYFKNEAEKERIKRVDEAAKLYEEKQKFDEVRRLVDNTPKEEVYKTVKREAGSYSVIAPDKTEAVVVRVDTPSEGALWVAALAVKNGKHSERVKTKKKAVALAIELLKEHKGI